MPPSFMLTLWGNDEAFITKYLTDTPGYYTTGDAGVIDVQGYLQIMTRIDDVINTCGHRLSTGRFEEVINEHPYVAESAAIGRSDPIKGDTPFAFVILKQDSAKKLDEDKEFGKVIEKQIKAKIRADIGAFAGLGGLIFVSKVPKTRSGKILRGTIRKIMNRQEYVTPATIDDMTSLELIQKVCDEYNESVAEEEGRK